MTDLQTKLTALRANLEKLPAEKQSFANSLLFQSTTRGLSPAQVVWVGKLVDLATGAAIDPTPVAVANAAAIVDLIDKAGAKLKRPKILFSDASGATYRISVAGPASRTPGALNVTSADGDYDGRTWYGRITRAGIFEPSRREPPATATAVAAALVAFAADPVGQARAFGRRTGACCFCARTLTDARSVHVGYGEICSDRYGLPWGDLPDAAGLI